MTFADNNYNININMFIKILGIYFQKLTSTVTGLDIIEHLVSPQKALYSM